MKRLIALVGLLAVVAAGCSSVGPSGAAVSVVASTNVWADVARQVAGRLAPGTVDVSAIISDPAADPHSYEPSARTALAIKRADVILENGGGYDDFMTTMRHATGTHAAVLDAFRISGDKTVGGQPNEHVWYDFPTVEKVAAQVAAALARADARHAGTYRANARAFTAELQRLAATEAATRSAHGGEGVAITEPVPLYLLDACGLVNRTPPEFSAAIEEGNDVPARVLQQTLDLFAHGRVALLAYNAQTSGAETDQVRKAAAAHDVPVVGMTETLPAGQDYVSWMSGNLAAVRSALGGA